MSVTEIKCADDMAAMAREALEQVWQTKQYRDLISAVLMANHVADWHFLNDRGRKKFGKPERDLMTAAYPEWDILRELANGTKHCLVSPKAEQDVLAWEHDDFWSSLGHVGEDHLDWFVEFDDKPRSVAVLIDQFLSKFANRSGRPK